MMTDTPHQSHLHLNLDLDDTLDDDEDLDEQLIHLSLFIYLHFTISTCLTIYTCKYVRFKMKFTKTDTPLPFHLSTIYHLDISDNKDSDRMVELIHLTNPINI